MSRARAGRSVGDAPSGRTGSFVIELFGLPGSGKSRLAAELARAPEGAGLDRPSSRIAPDIPVSVRVPRKLGLAAAECARHPGRSAAAARAMLGSQPEGRTSGARRWFHWLVTQRLMSSARARPGVHLFDEGVLQALWSVGLRGHARSALDRIAAEPARWALPDLVLVVEAPTDELDRRLSARPSRHSRVQEGDDAEARRSELARGHALADRILAWWGEVFGETRPVIRVENGAGASPEDAAAAALPSILRRAEARGGGRGSA